MKLLVLALVLSTGCLQLDAEVSALCSTRHDVAVEAAPLEEVTFELDVALAISELEALGDLETELRLDHVRFAATAGVDGLGFVDAATIALGGRTLIACDGDCARDGLDLLLLAEDGALDPDDYADDTLAITATIHGELPTVAWTMAIETCAEATATGRL